MQDIWPTFCKISNIITALQCPSEWSKYNNHCYKLMTDRRKWFAASSRCRQHGAMLISINDQAENYFVKNLISNYKRKVPAIWMGLHKKSGQWKWTDGSRLLYKNWVPGEPNNNKWYSNFKGENCAVVYSKWNDFRCGAAYAYICEKQSNN
uniref:C-type lectin domain-containing protein n=1 Tax=Branchiostoma floridae TaxID=7739 RepID=C3Z9L6_BRAFL|eukprot:XP_002594701.1 hypothetical protein BRAFLDRAFT_240469 [Branchiostoma floridae]